MTGYFLRTWRVTVRAGAVEPSSSPSDRREGPRDECQTSDDGSEPSVRVETWRMSVAHGLRPVSPYPCASALPPDEAGDP